MRSREQAVREGGDTQSELEQLKRTLHQLQADLQAAEQNSAQVSQSWKQLRRTLLQLQADLQAAEQNSAQVSHSGTVEAYSAPATG